MLDQEKVGERAPRPSMGEQIGSREERDGTGRNLEKKGKGKWFAIAFVLLVILGGIYWFTHRQKPSATNAKGPGGRPEIPPVPVVAGTAAKKDVPIYLDGLGTVQAFNTVTVRARVDGQLQRIAFTEGADVHAGDLLAEIDPAPFQALLEQAEAKKAQDMALLANAQVELHRDTDLLANKVVAQDVFDAQKATVDQLIATVKADQAAIDSAKVQLGYTKITSPLDGRIGIRQIDQGNVIHDNDSNGLVVITQLRPISVVFTLPEQNLSEIHKQMAGGELTVLAVDRDNTTVLSQGKLAVIDNQIDTSTGTIKLKATFANDDLRLWPGQFVNARLHLMTRKDAVVVPASVIQRGPEGAYAFVIKNDSTVQIRPVKVGPVDQGQALVTEGLNAGEQIVVDGQYKLQPGSKVKIGQSTKPGDESTPKRRRAP